MELLLATLLCAFLMMAVMWVLSGIVFTYVISATLLPIPISTRSFTRKMALLATGIDTGTLPPDDTFAVRSVPTSGWAVLVAPTVKRLGNVRFITSPLPTNIDVVLLKASAHPVERIRRVGHVGVR